MLKGKNKTVLVIAGLVTALNMGIGFEKEGMAMIQEEEENLNYNSMLSKIYKGEITKQDLLYMSTKFSNVEKNENETEINKRYYSIVNKIQNALIYNSVNCEEAIRVQYDNSLKILKESDMLLKNELKEKLCDVLCDMLRDITY